MHSFSSNRGKGAALNAAFKILFSRGFTAVVTVDADGQHLPEEIPRLFGVESDLVLGTRDHLFAQMGVVRRFSNHLSSSAISWAAGQALSDVQTGFRLYTRELIERTGFPESGFEAESAVVVRAVRRGLRVDSTPVRLGKADDAHQPLSIHADSQQIAAGYGERASRQANESRTRHRRQPRQRPRRRRGTPGRWLDSRVHPQGDDAQARAIEAASDGRAHGVLLELQDRERPGALVHEIEESFGQIEALVNNAGVRRESLLAMTPDRDWDDIMNINLAGSFRCCRASCRR